MNCPSFQWDFEEFAFPLTQSENVEAPSVPFRHGSRTRGGPTPPFVHWERDAASAAAAAGCANKVSTGMARPQNMTTAAIACSSGRVGREHEKRKRDTPNP